MIDVIKAASYIFKRYKDERNSEIDEMKLHKLMYFSQRESIIRTGQPMFDEQFEAWKYGPVIVKVRNKYKAKALNELPSQTELAPFLESFNYVFQHYAPKESWSLSILAHGESSWQHAREGYGDDDRCDVPMALDDIIQDAERIKMRRFYFDEILPQLNKEN
jgi:phage protein